MRQKGAGDQESQNDLGMITGNKGLQNVDGHGLLHL